MAPLSDCAACGVDLDLDESYWLHIGTEHPVAMCAACAETHVQLYAAREEIHAAEAIIRQAHQRLNAGQVAQ